MGEAASPKSSSNPLASQTVERSELMRQGLVNMLGPVFSGLTGIVLVPLMFRRLGAEVYGLWVIVMALVDRFTGFGDFGMSWSVIREIAGSVGGSTSEGEVERLVSAAANFYLVIAICGAGLIAAAGFPIGRYIGAQQSGPILPVVFVFAAGGFIATQMFSYQIVILQGLRRFDLSNFLSICSTLITAIAIVVAIAFGRGLLGVIQAQAAGLALCALAAYCVVIHTEPRFRQRLGRFDWAALRPHMGFSLGNQLISLLAGATWQCAPFLIGFMLGPAWVSSYQIGRKFPAAAAALLWPFAVVLFPAASEHQRASDLARAGEALEGGTRWLVLMALPVCVELWILAPSLLQAWLHDPPAGSLAVFRLMTAAILANVPCLAAVSVLLGRGAIGVLLQISAVQAAVVVAITWLLLPRVGVEGAAWALVAVTPFSSAAIVSAAGRRCGVPFSRFVQRVFAGLYVPLAACSLTTFAVRQMCRTGQWGGLIFGVFAGTAVYGIALYLIGANQQERLFARCLISDVRMTAAQGFSTIRTLTRRLPLS
jgi:O-antigen/teichoic acid export membrane protein